MALSREWRVRIECWRDELRRQLLEPLFEVPLEGFVTTEQLDAEAAALGPFLPMPRGTRWGAKWEYGWFRGAFDVPPDAAGRRLVLVPDVGGESAVYLDGQLVGAQDHEHREILLHRDGEPGHHRLLIEAYAGHGLRRFHAGPTPPERPTLPETPRTQTEVRGCSVCAFEEETYQLLMDVETLLQLRDQLDQNSLRVSEIDDGLRSFTLRCDPELPRPARAASVVAARAGLAPLLRCRNGSTAPTLFLVGHAHIDVAWLWPLAETERKCARTFATQLALMAEYPEYRFLQSQPHVYDMVRRRYPALYARVREAVAAGSWIADGAMWVEADTNLPGGESLVRQLLHGKRFLRDELGVESEVLWLPDVFGYSAALPQILRGCGVRYFATAKIAWAYFGQEAFPHNTFLWEGIDGSEVQVHLCNDYCSETGPAALSRRWNERVQKDGLATRLVPFGWGDGGGGPTRDHLEFLRRQADLEGAPRTLQAPPLAYFRDQEARGVSTRYVGELYFPCHRGTYTSQARTKRGNRRCEIALREAELWSALASAHAGSRYPAAALAEAWVPVLLNQFHDILPGSSIERVYEEAEAAYRHTEQVALDLVDAALGVLGGHTDPEADALTVANSLGWARQGLLALPLRFQGVTGAAGAPVAVQRDGDHLLAEVTLPPCGLVTLRAAPPGEEDCGAVEAAAGTAGAAVVAVAGDDPHAAVVLENEHLRATLDSRGEITSLWDKDASCERLRGPGNQLRLYRDVPSYFDAWDIDSMYEQAQVALPQDAEIAVLCAGPLLARVQVRRQIGASPLVQRIELRRGSRRIDFHTEIDWHERHKLLKVAFATDIAAREALHEIQFGHLARPTHQSRPGDADRFEVPAHRWSALCEEGRGAAVLNESKYGISVSGGTLALTLLRAPMAPDMNADQGRQSFAYAFYCWNGPFLTCDLVRQAYDFNVPPRLRPGSVREGGAGPWLQVDAANVVLETVKLAEDGSGDLIVRLYEAKRTSTRCTLRAALPFSRVARVNLLEEAQGPPLAAADGAIPLVLRPFEIVTLRLGR